ncbi:Mov34/MPN/PAD-1 family protein [Deinococcus sp. VB343]|uniref:Mov34/MPN/PAD-1 family protein n=1 Tax=Deinococcus sp. VB343 TaxID=3385567 RepID=UPI0039C9E58A
MRLAFSPKQREALQAALQRAGRREIGGQLYGEQLAPSHFLVTYLTVQHTPGTISRFIVDLTQAAKDAFTFFQCTQRKYARFNYIGEWHSHPSYAVLPSSTDRSTMRTLVTDLAFKGNFAVLLIARLDEETLTAGAWLFDPAGQEVPVQLEWPE